MKCAPQAVDGDPSDGTRGSTPRTARTPISTLHQRIDAARGLRALLSGLITADEFAEIVDVSWAKALAGHTS